jgi:hypothetical protein
MYLQTLAQRSLHFAQRQTHDFKLVLGRRTLHGLATGLTTQYSSLYATLLGANPVQLSAARARNGPADGRRILSGFVQVFKQGPELLACSVAC